MNPPTKKVSNRLGWFFQYVLWRVRWWNAKRRSYCAGDPMAMSIIQNVFLDTNPRPVYAKFKKQKNNLDTV